MSASAAKATRREIRRAVGVEALGVIGETQQNTQKLIASVRSAHERMDHFEDAWRVWREADTEFRRQVALTERAYVDGRDTDIERAVSAFRDRTLWGRLRWLVMGR